MKKRLLYKADADALRMNEAKIDLLCACCWGRVNCHWSNKVVFNALRPYRTDPRLHAVALWLYRRNTALARPKRHLLNLQSFFRCIAINIINI